MSSAAIDTPFGPIRLSVAVGAMTVAGRPESERSSGPDGRILGWIYPEFKAELLIAPVEPSVPSGRHVNRCVVASWRITAGQSIRSLRFVAQGVHESWPEGGPATGERLSAVTWVDNGTELSLGAPDADGLLHYERAGIPLPRHWRALVDEDDPATVVIEEYLDSGLEVRLPALERGEVGHFHFAVAWADSSTQNDIPWFAVDVEPSTLKALFDRMNSRVDR